MAGIKLASFPNSRIKPRAATRVAFTSRVTIPNNVPTLLLAANPNRTYVSVYNESATDVFYNYGGPVVDPASSFKIPGFGTISDMQSPQDIYVLQSSGGDIVLSIDQGEG